MQPFSASKSRGVRCVWPAVVAALLGMWLSSTAVANPPRYLVLRAPYTTSHHDRVYSPGVVVPLEVQPYAWGWFGAQPRSHAAAHRGYYNETWFWRW